MTDMTKKKRRDCTKCIAYNNMIGGDGYKCGLGFEVVEDIEGGYGSWKVAAFPYEDACGSIELPSTKEEFVKTAKKLGIEWEVEDVVDSEDLKWF